MSLCSNLLCSQGFLLVPQFPDKTHFTPDLLTSLPTDHTTYKTTPQT